FHFGRSPYGFRQNTGLSKWSGRLHLCACYPRGLTRKNKCFRRTPQEDAHARGAEQRTGAPRNGTNRPVKGKRRAVPHASGPTRTGFGGNPCSRLERGHPILERGSREP